MNTRTAARAAALILPLLAFALGACNSQAPAGRGGAPAAATPPAGSGAVSSADAHRVGLTGPSEVRSTADTYTGIAVESVFLASRGVSGAPVVTGTLTEDADERVTYSDEPKDRLRVTSADGSSVEFYVAAVAGDRSGDFEEFLSGDHELRFRVVDGKTVDLQISSSRRGEQVRRALSGTFRNEGTTYGVGLSEEGTSRRAADGGDSSVELSTRGNINAGNFLLDVEEKYSYQSRAAERLSEEVDQSINNAWALGADKFQFRGAALRQSFINGVPAERGRGWLAGGALLRGGAPYGTLRLDAGGEEVRVLLDTPEGEIVLRGWKRR